MKAISKLWALALILGLVVTGCSKNKSTSDMLKYVPDNVDIVVVTNPASVLESFGCKVDGDKVTDSAPLMDNLPSSMGSHDRDELETLLSIKGVNLESAVLAMNVSDRKAIGILNITDREQFIGWLEEIDDDFTRSKNDDDVIVSYDDEIFFIFDDDLAFITGGESAREAERSIEKFKEKAENKPMASWKKDYLANNPTLGIVVSYDFVMDAIQNKMSSRERASLNTMLNSMNINLDDYAGSSVCLNGVLAGNKATLSYEMFDKNGKPVEVSYMKGVTVNKDLMDYAGSQDFMVGLVGMPQNIDWQDAFNKLTRQMGGSDAEAVQVVAGIMSDLSGSIMASFGIEPGPFDPNDIDSYHFVLAADMKNGSPEKYMEMFGQMLDDDMRLEKVDNKNYKLIEASYVWDNDTWEYSYDFSNPRSVFNILADNNVIVFSNQPISNKGGCKVDLGDIKGATGVMAAKFDKSNPLAKLAGIKLNAEARIITTSSKAEGTLIVTGEDEDTPLLQTLMMTAKKLM